MWAYLKQFGTYVMDFQVAETDFGVENIILSLIVSDFSQILINFD